MVVVVVVVVVAAAAVAVVAVVVAVVVVVRVENGGVWAEEGAVIPSALNSEALHNQTYRIALVAWVAFGFLKKKHRKGWGTERTEPCCTFTPLSETA